MSLEDLKGLADSGTIQALDYVRRATSGDWVAAANIEELGLSNSERRTAATMEVTSSTDREISFPKDEWYCQFGGQELGPLSFANLLEYVELGQLTGDDEVKFGGNGNWRKVASIGRLMAALPYESAERSIRAHSNKPTSSSANATPASPRSRTPIPDVHTVREIAIGSIPARPQLPIQQPTTVPEISPEPVVERTPTPARSQQGAPINSGFGTSTSRTFPSTYGTYRPAPAPSRSSPRKKATYDTSWISDALENLKEPKAIGSVCVITVVLLIFGWGYLPKNRGADIQRYQTLKGLVDEIRLKRTSAPAELPALQQKLVKAAKEVAAEVKDKASSKEAAKQNLLWASRDEVPRFVQAGIAIESPAEENLMMRLQDTAYELGLEKRPPIELTQTATQNNDG